MEGALRDSKGRLLQRRGNRCNRRPSARDRYGYGRPFSSSPACPSPACQGQESQGRSCWICVHALTHCGATLVPKAAPAAATTRTESTLQDCARCAGCAHHACISRSARCALCDLCTRRVCRGSRPFGGTHLRGRAHGCGERKAGANPNRCAGSGRVSEVIRAKTQEATRLGQPYKPLPGSAYRRHLHVVGAGVALERSSSQRVA